MSTPVSDQEPRPARRRSPRRVILFSLAVVTALLLLVEAGSRVLLRARYGPQNLPPLPGSVQLPPKPRAAFRLLVLGGSTVYGEPLPNAGFVRRLGDLLQERFPQTPLEVWNLGQPGMDSSRVLTTLRRVLGSAPDTIIVYTGHNEFLRPETGYGPWQGWRERVERLATATLLRRVKNRLASQGALLPCPADLAVDRTSRRFSRKVETFEKNMGAMVRETSRAGVPLVLCTAAANLADWPPVARERAGRAPLPGALPRSPHSHIPKARGNAASSSEALPGRLHRDASTLFLLGKQEAALGRFEDAAAYFDLARDLDPVPWRVLDTFNRTIRSLSGTTGVFLADVDRVFRENSPGGLVGFSLFLDNCHPNPAGNLLLARTVFHTLETARIPTGLWEQSGGEPAADFRIVRQDEGLNREDLVQMWMHSALHCMKPPFFYLEAARRWLLQARELDPGNWEVWGNLASVSFVVGEADRAEAELRTALCLKGSALSAREWGKVPYLKSVLRETGREVPLPPHPDACGTTPGRQAPLPPGQGADGGGTFTLERQGISRKDSTPIRPGEETPESRTGVPGIPPPGMGKPLAGERGTPSR